MEHISSRSHGCHHAAVTVGHGSGAETRWPFYFWSQPVLNASIGLLLGRQDLEFHIHGLSLIGFVCLSLDYRHVENLEGA